MNDNKNFERMLIEIVFLIIIYFSIHHFHRYLYIIYFNVISSLKIATEIQTSFLIKLKDQLEKK